jgi:pimeloyl-ACP methyl ester carboxylesterase
VAPQTVSANGTEFTYLDDGPRDGPLALCLHGFPDTAHTWRYLLPRLADVGFHAVAPFMRGYAPSAVPADGRYDTGTLALDACGLHQALGGGEDAVLIGHDWGAFATYGAAAFIDRLWADWSPGFDGSWDAARVKEALASPESLSAAIGYYRATFAGPPEDPAAARAQEAAGTVASQPTLYLHGADDGCMGIDTIGPVTEHLPPGSEMVVVEGAGHFLHVERPDEVNDHIVRFLTA